MEQKQLKELPSVSEVLLNSNKYKSLNNKYLTYIIKSEIDHYRVVAKKGKLTLKRSQVIQEIVSEIDRLSDTSMRSVIMERGSFYTLAWVVPP